MPREGGEQLIGRIAPVGVFNELPNIQDVQTYHSPKFLVLDFPAFLQLYANFYNFCNATFS